MTLFETLFYYYTLFGESDDYVSMRKGIQELLDDIEYLKSLQHSVNVKRRFEKVTTKFKEIMDAQKTGD